MLISANVYKAYNVVERVYYDNTAHNRTRTHTHSYASIPGQLRGIWVPHSFYDTPTGHKNTLPMKYGLASAPTTKSQAFSECEMCLN